MNQKRNMGITENLITFKIKPAITAFMQQAILLLRYASTAPAQNHTEQLVSHEKIKIITHSNFSLCHSVQTGSVAFPASYPLLIWGFTQG
jgi:hypothetical protein